MLAVMPVYRRVGSFIILLHFLILIAVYKQDISTFSLLKLVQDSENLALNIRSHNGYKKIQQGTEIIENTELFIKIVCPFH